MVESKLAYEECRRQRLEENKKRMEELKLHVLAQSIKTLSPKPSPFKKRVSKQQAASVPLRRSGRFADKPAPNYKEDPFEPLLTRRRSYQRRNLLNRVYASDEERAYAIERAEEVQSGLDSQNPSFVKPMLQSHVTGGFWLGLPVHFCKNHLPHYDETITLVDEEENEFPTKYLADKTGLSGGWRGFSMDHELVDGDALVFQLVKTTTFKVFIIRAYQSGDNTREETNNEDKKGDSDANHLGRSSKRTRSGKR
ncbi:B3 domain-containing protein [Melia azedarach]|uniref:B3 domain-containing protein n=1 Tax=Melia azedarach TaxID=155640 RepID=A0ACC1XZE1_MELAZ|nr:B3 domain-containing protein [Melia azedarach]